MFKVKKNIAFCFLVFTCITLFTSCKKNQTAPDPPLSKGRLVIDLYRSLLKKDHTNALKKVEKLRVIEPSNVFLAILENTEKNNILISDVQSQLNNGKIEEAEEITKKAIQKQGLNETVSSLRKELSTVRKIKIYVEKLTRNDLDSIEMAKYALGLNETVKNYAPGGFLLDFAAKKLEEARELYSWESLRAIEDLKADSSLIYDGNTNISIKSTLVGLLRFETAKEKREFPAEVFMPQKTGKTK
ncbi:MAG: hypothetical protein QXH80_04280 [Candidatus Nanoarchaeia archaeon]